MKQSLEDLLAYLLELHIRGVQLELWCHPTVERKFLEFPKFKEGDTPIAHVIPRKTMVSSVVVFRLQGHNEIFKVFRLE